LLGLPVSMLCDREKTNIPASQIFFINAFVLDHVKQFIIYFPSFNELLKELDYNKQQYEELKANKSP